MSSYDVISYNFKTLTITNLSIFYSSALNNNLVFFNLLRRSNDRESPGNVYENSVFDERAAPDTAIGSLQMLLKCYLENNKTIVKKLKSFHFETN